MSDVSKGMMYHTLKESSSYMFHEQSINFLKIEGFRRDIFERALTLLMQKHENLRSVFNMLTFKRDGTLLPTQQDRHAQARVELALARAAAARRAGTTETSTRFIARGGQWTPSAALVRRMEQIALGREKCPRISPTGPAIK